ncbi:hypothetical protein ACF0H5_017572 [Mactra antiquata]
MTFGYSIGVIAFTLVVVYATSLEDDVAHLIEEVKQLKDDKDNMLSRLNQLEEENKYHRTFNEHLIEENRQLAKLVSNISTGLDAVKHRGRRSFLEAPYAFTAMLDHNVEHSGIDQTVIFNKVLLNDGNGYNNHTGVFTAQIDGVYMFYFAFGAGYEAHRLWMHIVVDGSQKVSGVADTLQAGHDAQGTNLVFLHLHQGDSVWVATYAIADVKIYGVPPFTTFSGMLMYQY